MLFFFFMLHIILKYAKIIIGNCMLLGGDEEDMVAAGRLYMNFKENILPKENIVSILPAASAHVLQQNRLPVIDAEEVKFHLKERAFTTIFIFFKKYMVYLSTMKMVAMPIRWNRMILSFLS